MLGTPKRIVTLVALAALWPSACAPLISRQVRAEGTHWVDLESRGATATHVIGEGAGAQGATTPTRIPIRYRVVQERRRDPLVSFFSIGGLVIGVPLTLGSFAIAALASGLPCFTDHCDDRAETTATLIGFGALLLSIVSVAALVKNSWTVEKLEFDSAQLRVALQGWRGHYALELDASKLTIRKLEACRWIAFDAKTKRWLLGAPLPASWRWIDPANPGRPSSRPVRDGSAILRFR